MKMNWMGWLLIGAGVLLLTRGGFFLFPLLWIPLIWLLFRGFFGGRRRAWGYSGGLCGQRLKARSASEARPVSEPAGEPTDGTYTGETMRL